MAWRLIGVAFRCVLYEKAYKLRLTVVAMLSRLLYTDTVGAYTLRPYNSMVYDNRYVHGRDIVMHFSLWIYVLYAHPPPSDQSERRVLTAETCDLRGFFLQCCVDCCGSVNIQDLELDHQYN